MAYRISGTTPVDTELLQQIRDLAWKQRVDVSEVIREAFKLKLYGSPKNWPADEDLASHAMLPREAK